MFIRATRTRSDEGTRRTHRLVRSVRIDGRVRQETLLNLGTGWDAPQELWLRIAHRTEEILLGRLSLFAECEVVEQYAQSLARQLRAKGIGLPGQPDPALARIDLDSMEHQEAVSVGAERICLKALEDLGFERILHQCGLKPRDGRISAALVAARMIHPSSAQETSRWLQADSALPELLGLEGNRNSLSRKALSRVSFLLWKNRASLQQGLRRQAAALFGNPDAIALYDLSNVHASGVGTEEPRRRGSRRERPQITTALMLDNAGVPRTCEIVPGNVSERGTLADAIGRLRAELGAGQPSPTVVLAAGMATEANLTWLQAQGFDWICVNRDAVSLLREGEQHLELFAAVRQKLRGSVADGRQNNERVEQRLYLRSQLRRQNEDLVLSTGRARFEAELRQLHEGLSRPGCTKRYERVLERVGRIRERHAKVSQLYEVEVERDSGRRRPGPNAVAIHFSCDYSPGESVPSAGTYLLRTSRTDWSLQEIVERYLQIKEVEAVFQALKGEAGSSLDWRKGGNEIFPQILVTVLAYHAVYLIRTRLEPGHNCPGWTSIRERLRNWVRVTTTQQEVDGAVVTTRQDVWPGAGAAEIARRVGVTLAFHRTRSRRSPRQDQRKHRPMVGAPVVSKGAVTDE